MQKYRKKPLAMGWRVFYLLAIRRSRCVELVNKSYDRISQGYDLAWTNHMRGLSVELMDMADFGEVRRAVDLTCGTGFATGLIAERCGGRVTGVDMSGGMLEQARRNYGERCEFVQSDILGYLKGVESSSVDLVSCCWGLGYSRPMAVMRQIARVLRKGGQAVIIDNSLFSLREVLWCSFLAFMERPEKLENVMRFGFLPGPGLLKFYMRAAGLKSVWSDKGSKSYFVTSGQEAIERLRVTGAAAGFEYACDEDSGGEVFGRFAEIIEDKYMRGGKIEIVHRYLAGIGVK